MRNVGILRVVVLSLFVLAAPVLAAGGDSHTAKTLMTVSGVVTKVQSGMIFVTTPRGQVMFAPTVLTGLQVGEKIEMQLNHSHAVIDAHPLNPPKNHEPGLIF